MHQLCMLLTIHMPRESCFLAFQSDRPSYTGPFCGPQHLVDHLGFIASNDSTVSVKDASLPGRTSVCRALAQSSDLYRGRQEDKQCLSICLTCSRFHIAERSYRHGIKYRSAHPFRCAPGHVLPKEAHPRRNSVPVGSPSISDLHLCSIAIFDRLDH
jgi:hypothetical protein